VACQTHYPRITLRNPPKSRLTVNNRPTPNSVNEPRREPWRLGFAFSIPPSLLAAPRVATFGRAAASSWTSCLQGGAPARPASPVIVKPL